MFVRIAAFTLFLLTGLSFYGFSQQDPVYTQYMNNLLTIQPAYAGISGSLNITGISRAQWVGFEGAPNTNTLTINGPLRRFNVGLGLSIVNDKWGPIRQNGVYVDYAYRVKLRQDQFLSFGLKGGFNIYQAYLTDIVVNDPNDPVFAYDVNFKFLPNLGVGIMWHSDRFFLGVSSPKILKNRIQSQNSETVYREVLHFYGMGGYVFFLSDVLKFKPTILYRWAERTPSFADFSGSFLLYDRVWIGATYRLKNSYGLIFQFNVNTQLKFGYSYDQTTFHPTQVNSGTHEFLISYDFIYSRRGRQVVPRYF
ncbi:MAG TPA: type IX secretion system membrane protein PorP/SprF [Prolixibacteraceae bacterium]|nr:type IX secretion system membrane protein PorP/SprF [Prolixibacteraceae bacterium]